MKQEMQEKGLKESSTNKLWKRTSIIKQPRNTIYKLYSQEMKPTRLSLKNKSLSKISLELISIMLTKRPTLIWKTHIDKIKQSIKSRIIMQALWDW